MDIDEDFNNSIEDTLSNLQILLDKPLILYYQLGIYIEDEEKA